MESIRIARSLGERPDILFTVFEHNVHQIEKIWQQICLPNDLVLILNPVFAYNAVKTGDSLSPETLQTLTHWGKQKNVYLNDAFISLRQDGGNHVHQPVCRAGSSTVIISPDDKLIVPCYHLGTEAFAIEGNLYNLYHSAKVQQVIAMEGKLPACEGCTINCYMQPSFAVELNKYWWKSLPSTWKYAITKGTWKQLFA
jgi:MoaA/NifB/PqqE/SkfB family radical SAM enzyme